MLREVAAVSGVGICLGLGCGIATTVLVRSLLHGIQPVEWYVLLSVSAAIAALALASSWLAARPWLRVDPVETLRHS